MENQVTNNNDEIEIDLGEIFHLILSRLGLIILSGIILGVISIIGTMLFITPQYESTTKIMVLNKQDSNTLTSADMQTSTQLTKDYAELIKSRTYLLLCHAFRNSVAVPHFIIVIATIFSNLLSFIIQSKFYFLSIFCRLNIKFVGTAATNIPAIINPIHCFFITLLLLIKYFHRFFFCFLLNLSLSDNPCLVKLQHHTASICYSITPACFLSHNYQSVAYSVFSTSAAPFW